MTISPYQVIVVGAGPTGLATANLLAHYGVRVLLVERNATTVQEPRAVSIDDESLRTMQAFGAVDTVLSEVEPGYGSDYLSPRGRLFLRVHPTAHPYGYPRRNAFRQPRLEAQLRDHLAEAPSAERRFGASVVGLMQDADGVTLEIEDADGARRSVRAEYVVAADGAGSAIRAMLGLTLDGATFAEKWLIVDLENSPAPSRHTVVYCDPARPCISLPGPNRTRRFEFKLLPGDDPLRMTEDAFVTGLLNRFGAVEGSRICRKTVYTFHARLASRWAVGRVFLAGDACHLTPPFAGQGMNSGIRDASNIAWKLARVVEGALPARILGSYELERRDHVREMIKLALRMGRIMGPSNRLAGLLTRIAFRTMGYVPAVRDYFALMKYKPKPRFADGLLLSDGRPKRLTAVGRLLPQPLVATSSGDRLLDEVLGDGFTLLGFTSSIETFVQATADPIFARLGAKRVLVGGLGETFWAGGEIVRIGDPQGALLKSIDAASERIFLVRPDRYVLGAFAAEEAAHFVRRLDALIAPREPAKTPALAPSLTAAVRPAFT
jgi:3-(3-hydroxy-phenyl)propionate hydroxylase